MRIFSSILFILILQFSGIIMPLNNFNDEAAVNKVYNGLQEEDPDLNLGEFIFEKLLALGKIIDHDNDEEGPPYSKVPSGQLPFQMQQGNIIFNAAEFTPGKKIIPAVKPTCLFKEDNYTYNFLPSIFHPPLSV